MCNGRSAVLTALLWKRVRPRFTFPWAGCMTPTGCGSMPGKEPSSSTLPDAAGGLYAVKAVHDALVSNCSGGRDSAHRGLALDHSSRHRSRRRAGLGAVRRYRLALSEMERSSCRTPNQYPGQRNLPARSQGRRSSAPAPSGTGRGMFSRRSILRTLLVSKVPHLLGRASLWR